MILYLIFYFSGVKELAFGTFIIFKLIFPALPGLVTAKYAALNNFRYR